MNPPISRNIIDDEDGTFSPVLNFLEFEDFSCGDSDLDDFIFNDAEEHRQSLVAVTYSYCLKEAGRLSKPIGFITLSNDAIRLSNRRRNKIFPRKVNYREHPAVKIGRFGVDKQYQKIGIGSYLIDIVKTFFITENRTGCRFITVDAYNKKDTLNFYKKNEFEFLSAEDSDSHTSTMYFDLLRLTN